MGILSWFDSCSVKEREAAKNLISCGKTMAAGGCKHLSDSFPSLLAVAEHSRTEEAYYHYYTIAFATMALIGANMYFPKSRRQGTTHAISTELEKWHKGAYKKDGLQLMNELNSNNGRSTEVSLGSWIIDQISRDIRDNKYRSTIQELKQEKQLMSALGNHIMTQSAESVVGFFLEDKNG
jgi:hypothetical protein